MMLQRRLVRLVRLAPVPAALAVFASLTAIGCAVAMAVAVAELLRRLFSGDELAAATGPLIWAMAAAVARAALLWMRDLAFAYTAARVKARAVDPAGAGPAARRSYHSGHRAPAVHRG